MWLHPSKKLIGEESNSLKDKRIVVGVTGSVACYKTVDIVRELMRRGAEVHVVLSPSAAELISPKLFEWATGNRVIVEFGGEVGHIQLAENCDSMIIAPATANTLAKLASSIADTSVTLTALTMRGIGKPVGIVPAMHLHLFKSIKEGGIFEKLNDLDFKILPPVIEGDKAKFPEVREVALFAEALTLRGRDLEGLNILVTAGPTREYLDPVRYLTNSSSGLMGVSIAREAYFRGARVTLIHGPITVNPPPWIESVRVESTQEMLEEVLKNLKNREFNVAIFAGAPVDFKFEKPEELKIDSRVEELMVKLLATPKIISRVRREFPKIYIVGFSAETVSSDEELVEKAREKMYRYNIDLVVANNVARRDIGFTSKYNEVYIVDKEGGIIHVPKSTKEEVARILLDNVRDKLCRGRVLNDPHYS